MNDFVTRDVGTVIPPRESLCESLRWRADRLHSQGHKCPSPPCPFEEEAAELRAAAAVIERYEAVLRYMADYQMTGTEMTLHIDFQGKAREAMAE